MTDTFLYTFPQWFVFAALFAIIYGWVENKKIFRLIGILVFILLGILSVYLILGDFFAAGNFLTPEEVASEEIDNEILNEIPLQAKLLPGYWSFIAASVLAIPALVLDWTNKKRSRLFIVLTILLALMGFFVIVGAVRGM
jgi:predicted membrane channel-forming protein YqfA (hemolysin III family)